MPFIFGNLLSAHYLISNFQPFPTVNTIGHINTWATVFTQKNWGNTTGGGGKPSNWGGGACAHRCPDIELPLPGLPS